MAVVEIKKPSEEELRELGVKSWSIWECEPSVFDWEYDDVETCYILEGDVKVRTPEGEFHIESGDLVRFAQGLKCTWEVSKKVRKHYKFG